MRNKNLGKDLEKKIERQNAFYRRQGIAEINKVPNAWVVKRVKGKIVTADPVPTGMCDFIGTSRLVNGRCVSFDAKETKRTKSFPLANIDKEQMNHLERNQESGGVSFFIVWFTELVEMYLVPFDFMNAYWIDHEYGGPASVPYEDIKRECPLIREMDYLELYVEHYE